MPFLKIPASLETTVSAHKKWLDILQKAERLIEDDVDLQEKAKKGLLLKERRVPPEVIGRLYAEYCDVINRMYDSYLRSVHLQRAPCILEIISVFMKRLYELRNELVHIIVNDYIYVDDALIQIGKTPVDIQIVIPYHFPLESRSDGIESLLQQMWAESERRKNASPPKAVKSGMLGDDEFNHVRLPSEVHVFIQESEPTLLSEEYIQALIIQKHERFRQYFIEDFKAKCRRRRLYFSDNVVEAPLELRNLAATLIQKVYRRYMELKRQHVLDIKRDVILGLIPDPFRKRLDIDEENCKIYERQRKIRDRVQETYLMELERENTRLVVFKRDNQIDDITDHVRTWFKEWYYGYGFFPDYPYEAEGGTMLVIRGDYPTIAEKVGEDEKYQAATKGKTKEQLKAEAKQAKADALLKEAVAKEQKKKEAEQMFKLRCNPQSDPGYQPQSSQLMGELGQALQNYRTSWSIYDEFPPDQCPEVIYGYIQTLLTEELMCRLHKDCRKYVDELMRLDLKLLIKIQQEMYKRVGWKYPKLGGRKKPKVMPPPKPLKINDELLSSLEGVFDLNIISKPTSKIKEVYGDFNYAAYEFNLRDPDAKFPPPGYGDVRRRLVLSCVYGMGIEPGAPRNKAVLLLGPARNGKSFMVDAVCGELNAVKIDISPEVFSAMVERPAKMLADVFVAAKLFQPSVIYMRNIERVFSKKTSPEERLLNAKVVKGPLAKLLKQMLPEDKIMFIATCSNPFAAQAKPMVSLFTELILVPRTDYGSLRVFLYDSFQKIRSMPRDYCVQALAQVLQGYGFGVILELFDKVMDADRIVKLNVTPLCPTEFLYHLIEMGVEATSLQEYKEYTDFFIENSPLSKERKDYEIINIYRAAFYEKMAKKSKEKDS